MRIGLYTVVFAIIALAVTPTKAPAQFGTRATSQTVRHVHTLPTHVQRMSAELMLIALGIDADARVMQLRDARNEFVSVLNSLRYGDTMMEVPLLDEPEVTDAVALVNALWPDFDDIVFRGTSDRALSAEDVRLLAELNLPLTEASMNASGAFRSVFAGGSIPSILIGTTLQCEAQALLVQRMLKEYLMVVYGTDVEFDGAMLEGSYRRFDRVLAGLSDGDPELRLLPAPTPEIAERLAEIGLRWAELRPFLATARQRGRASPDQVSRVARSSEQLYRDMTAIARMYADL